MWLPEPGDLAVGQDRARPSMDCSAYFSLHFNSKHFDPRNPRPDGHIVISSGPFPFHLIPLCFLYSVSRNTETLFCWTLTAPSLTV